MRKSGVLLLLFVALGVARAQDEIPDLSLLEYLGSWEESDEEWLIVAENEDELEDEHEDEASGQDEKADEQEQK